MRNDPYRVIVWGPGAVGRAALRELVKRSDCRIVGVLAYSPEKNGKDVGELLDRDPIGVRVTTDKAAIFALEADVVLWAGTLPFDAPSIERDVIRLLESGKHVISSAGFHYAHNHGKEYTDRFEAACRKGRSCLHGTGENPGFWFERVGLTLTGVCSDVERLEMHEYVDCSIGTTSTEVLGGVGFGSTPEQANKPGPMSVLWKEYYFVEYLNMSSIALFGRALDRVEHTTRFHVTEHDIVLSKTKGDPLDMVIPRGRIHAMSHTFSGFLSGDKPKLVTSINWYLRKENSPFPVKSADCWLIELEGTPVSLRCEIAAFASLKDELIFYPGDPTSSTWYATAVAMIQAIPVLCGREPGIVYPSVFTHSSTDLRRLEGQRSLVG